MANAIQYGMQRIVREVPDILLSHAFGSTNWGYRNDRSSLDANIRAEVIEKIVLPDCNIVGGEVITVPLAMAHWEYMENGVRIGIPLGLTHGRHITSILSIELINRGLEPYADGQYGAGATGTPEVFLVAPNTIFIPVNPYNKNSHLRCTIENDENLGNFNQKALLVFGDLCVLAAKGYIFNKLAINITITSNTGGLVDGRLRSIIDEYSDSWEMYKELISIRWKKIALLQDRNQHIRFIQLGLGS